MVFEINAKGEVKFANQRARELTGYTKEELEHNFDANRLVAPEDIERSKANMKLMFAGEMRQSNEYTWIRKDGTHFPVLLTSSPVIEKGNVLGARGIIADLSERKCLEKQVQDNERLATIGQTAGMVGHDIRNPLQAIVSELYLAKELMNKSPDNKGKQDAIDSINFIQEQVDYISKIVADLQDYARNTKPTLAKVDIEYIVRNAFSGLTIPQSVEAKVYVQPNLELVSDADYLRRIISNLGNNGVQAMPNGGKLTIDVKKINDSIQITVEDTGGGMSDEVKDKIFTPLFTTKSKGQGFGLAVVKKFVEQLGGIITFESQLGKGTKFIIELPAQG